MRFKLSTQTRLTLYMGFFGVLVFLLDRFGLPYIGMLGASIIIGFLMAFLLVVYLVLSKKETDERERELQMQSDSAALYVVIAGLLAASIFFPHSEFGMVFWGVAGLAVVGRIVVFIYQKYK